MTAVLDAPTPPPPAQRRRWRPNAYLVVSVVLLVACLGLVGWVLGQRAYSDRLMAQRAQAAVQAVAEEWTAEERQAMTDAARAYNARLLALGSPVLGDAVDPFTGEVLSQTDADYQAVLRLTDTGIMGRVLVPKIGVDLPVMHGSDDDALRHGAGHLYGTSVPIGGTGTLSVLSAHSGQVTSTGFLRLSELDLGDFVYIQTMGETHGYVVDRIDVVASTDFSHFVIQPDEDRLILMTCTPIGINTERLLVSAVRANIPDVVPAVADAPTGSKIPQIVKDVTQWAALVIIVLVVVAFRRRRRRRRLNVRQSDD